jgi:hypothetical protein
MVAPFNVPLNLNLVDSEPVGQNSGFQLIVLMAFLPHSSRRPVLNFKLQVELKSN